MRNKPSSLKDIAKYYQLLWKAALGRSDVCEHRAIPKEILVAVQCGDFSGIKRLIKKCTVSHPHQIRRCLSIGCGTARDLEMVKTLYPSSTVVGIDTSRIALMKARRNVLEGNFICSCISHLPLGKETGFDTVIAGHVLEYFSRNSLKEILANISDFVATDSRFYITFWQTPSNRRELDRTFYEIELALMEYGWQTVHAEAYSFQEISPLAEGGFVVARKKVAASKTTW